MATVSDSFDGLILGAGLSGIGAAMRLAKDAPQKSFAMLDMREDFGGTWDLFQYPGVRSDSDMYTFGFQLFPWVDTRAIGPGHEIKSYLSDAVTKFALRDKIYTGQKVTRADWNSEANRWTVTVKDLSTGKTRKLTTQVLISCTGYYNYDQGYTPDFPGQDTFTGDILHPQAWPKDYDYADKNVVVIGSGATAMTLVPAMADKASHVTLLQRTPTYVFNRPSIDLLAASLGRILPTRIGAPLIRWANAGINILLFVICIRAPKMMRRFFMWMARMGVGKDYDVETHFNPPYNPWEQRLCVIPDGDLFKAIKADKATIKTDQVAQFTKSGVQLKSGETLPADIVVTATGLDLKFLGGIDIRIDGQSQNTGDMQLYRGMMLSNIPNFVVVFGYTNNSWTLKADLTADYVARLLNYMDKNNLHRFCPEPDPETLENPRPLIEMSSTYFQRVEDIMPKQGPKAPWRTVQNYFYDYIKIRWARFKDGVLKLT